MTHATITSIDVDKSKNSAQKIKTRLEALGLPIKLNHALEAMAIAYQFPNWATMKAGLEGAPDGVRQAGTAESEEAFHVGGSHECNQDGSKSRLLISKNKALQHVHVFGTNAGARLDHLLALARNSIENGAGLIFCQTVENSSVKDRIVTELLGRATEAGRHKDFFVVDCTSDNSRLGSSINLFQEADPDEIADLLVDTSFVPPKFWARAHDVLHEIVVHLGQRKLTSEAILGLLDADHLDLDGTKRGTLPKDFKARIDKIRGTAVRFGDEFFEHVQAGVKLVCGRSKYFDLQQEACSLRGALSRNSIMVVFLTRSPGGLSERVSKAVAAAIGFSCRKRSGEKEGYPDTIIFDEVDRMSRDTEIAAFATRRNVCLVFADQCPTPPTALSDSNATLFHALKVDDDSSSHHYLVTQNGRRRIGLHWARRDVAELIA